jgi:hypothetical protein
MQRNAFKSANQQLTACLTAIKVKPEYASLISHFGTTNAQITDTAKPTAEETRLFGQYHDELQPCISHYREGYQSAGGDGPAVANIVAELQANNRENLVLISEQKLTWGEIDRRALANLDKLRADFAALAQAERQALMTQQLIEAQQQQAASMTLLGLSNAMHPYANGMQPHRPLSCTTQYVGTFAYTNC